MISLGKDKVISFHAFHVSSSIHLRMLKARVQRGKPLPGKPVAGIFPAEQNADSTINHPEQQRRE
jgi:hypothetical protein